MTENSFSIIYTDLLVPAYRKITEKLQMVRKANTLLRVPTPKPISLKLPNSFHGFLEVFFTPADILGNFVIWYCKSIIRIVPGVDVVLIGIALQQFRFLAVSIGDKGTLLNAAATMAFDIYTGYLIVTGVVIHLIRRHLAKHLSS